MARGRKRRGWRAGRGFGGVAREGWARPGSGSKNRGEGVEKPVPQEVGARPGIGSKNRVERVEKPVKKPDTAPRERGSRSALRGTRGRAGVRAGALSGRSEKVAFFAFLESGRRAQTEKKTCFFSPPICSRIGGLRPCFEHARGRNSARGKKVHEKKGA